MTEKCSGDSKTCEVDECHKCAVRVCPFKEPLHYHHDGCPVCEGDVTVPANDLKRLREDAEKWRSLHEAGVATPAALSELKRKAALFDQFYDIDIARRINEKASAYDAVVERAEKELKVISEDRKFIEKEYPGFARIYYSRADAYEALIRKVMGWDEKEGVAGNASPHSGKTGSG